jgi:glycosyltransferase involved in cell wall biosynthesis
VIDNSYGLYKFVLKKYHFHFNINLFKKIFIDKYDIIILGGSWNDINVLVVVILKKMRLISAKVAFWTEANYLTFGARNDNIFKFLLRKFVYGVCDSFYLIPGEMASKTLFDIWGIDKRQTIFFPNLIDKNFYTLRDEERDIRRLNKVPVFLIVARLNERTKGILNFLSNIPTEADYLIRIAGEGGDRIKYEQYIKEKKLLKKVVFLGNLNEDELRKEYIRANVFVLPSFSDPSPLSLVEASYMQLPLLISNRCGNHYEIIQHGVNGFLFDPINADEIREYFSKLLRMTFFDLEKMGNMAHRSVEDKYDNAKVLGNFINELSGLL